MNLGKKIFIADNIEVAEKYLELAKNDEAAAQILEQQKFYNQAAYFYIQAMEKFIKNHISQKINVLNKYFADELSKTMGHSLNKSLELLVKVYSGSNAALFEQMNRQLEKYVLQEVNFKFLNNSLRYPIYNEKYTNYAQFILTKSDCNELKKILAALKLYLKDLTRVK